MLRDIVKLFKQNNVQGMSHMTQLVYRRSVSYTGFRNWCYIASKTLTIIGEQADMPIIRPLMSNSWCRAHPEQRRLISRNYAYNHPDEHKQSLKSWRKRNPDKVKAPRCVKPLHL